MAKISNLENVPEEFIDDPSFKTGLQTQLLGNLVDMDYDGKT